MLPPRLDDQVFTSLVGMIVARLQKLGYPIDNRAVNVVAQDILKRYKVLRLRLLPMDKVEHVIEDIECWYPTSKTHDRLKFQIIRRIGGLYD